VSFDLNSDSASLNLVAIQTSVMDGNLAEALIWYDTEPGCPCRTLGIAHTWIHMK
jgi:hypothetical protein